MNETQNQNHPYQTAVTKLIDAISADKTLTLESVDKLTDGNKPNSFVNAQITVRIYTGDEADLLFN